MKTLSKAQIFRTILMQTKPNSKWILTYTNKREKLKLLKGDSAIRPETPLRLVKVLGRSPKSWLATQDWYDRRVARNMVNLGGVQQLDFETVYPAVRIASYNAGATKYRKLALQLNFRFATSTNDKLLAPSLVNDSMSPAFFESRKSID